MARNKYDIDETLKAPFNINHIKRSFKYISRHRNKMLLAISVSAIAAVMGLIFPLASRYVIDVYIPNKDLKSIATVSIILFICSLGIVILNYLRGKIMVYVGNDIILDLRKDLFSHLQKLSFQFYDSRPHGKILVRVVNYVNAVMEVLSNSMINIVLELVNIVLIIGFMLLVSPRLTLVVLSGVPILLFFIFAIRTLQRRAWQQFSNKNSNLNAYMHESLTGMRITQAFVREEVNAGLFNSLCIAVRSAWMKCIRVSQTMPFVVDNISTWVFCLLYFIGFSSHTEIGVLVAMSGYTWRFWTPIQNLGIIYNNLINSMAYLERIYETMDEPVEVCDSDNAYELPEVNGYIRFKDVVFGYDDDNHVLNGVSFDIKPGESVAIVGPTGAGKTTIISLLSRFYNTNGGSIEIDGNDIGGVTLSSLRRQMGIMLQDSFIFSNTIMENIRYGKLDASDEEVINAAKLVYADEFISKMKDGYQTQLYERGAQLSAGQKQLISFARTLLANPRILILDEATSTIDTHTERMLQDGLKTLLEGRTSIIIAHRLSTIINSTCILYIQNGVIAEQGSHNELIAKKGLYYQLHMSQQ